jgi:hypothetical protein
MDQVGTLARGAAGCFRRADPYFTELPALCAMVTRETDDGFQLSSIA